MKIIAGLDIQNGRCVQLSRDTAQLTKVFSEDPIELIHALEKTGVDQLHIVDLDGVFSGDTKMLDSLKYMRSITKLPIQFGGGIRNFEMAESILSIGIDQIVIGTSAIEDEELLIQLIHKYDDRIIVAADVYKNEVYIDGGEENSAIELNDFLNTLQLLNVKTVMITDISLDGSLSGINKTLVDTILLQTNLSVILSGGVNSDSDLEYLIQKDIYGTVISTAIFENIITI